LASPLAAALLGGALLAAGGCARQPAGKRVVVFWQFSPLASIQPIVARFEAEHPVVGVRVEQLSWQSGREMIVARSPRGAPDLCEMAHVLPGLVADSTLLDLTDRRYLR
jgi:ABC-type glycerol-3-phosphate transport system substrate-binding protein